MRNTQGYALKRQKNTLLRNVSARPVDGAQEAITATVKSATRHL
ncbi:hypothetical protein J2853_005286 [Streptosporangium lutulentum]|uniref:Uncharacterized protein n=1 Tax=Streptosporangium lutulentum TaxID=1461250 RepID=A0ABT9QH41_9ACTN|nr:hypothetical protein [Streptosporangium lutulentum]